MALAQDVYDSCHIYQTGVDDYDLIIEYDDGTARELRSGEDEHGYPELWDGDGHAVDHDSLGITEDGQLDILDVVALCEEDVWDGHNIVSFVPRHSWSYVHGRWQWTEVSGDVRWHLELHDPETRMVCVIQWEPLDGHAIIASNDDGGLCEEVVDQLSGLRYREIEAVAEDCGASVSRHNGYGNCAAYAVTCPADDLGDVIDGIRSKCGVQV